MAPASTQDLPAAAIPVTPEQPRRPVPSIERALSGPAADRIDSWQRRVRVVPGGQGPGKRDQETLDRDRARLPLAGPRRIVFLGCTSGAGQTVTALMTGQLLAALRGVPVAAIDLNPGHGSLIRPGTDRARADRGRVPGGFGPAGPSGPGRERRGSGRARHRGQVRRHHLRRRSGGVRGAPVTGTIPGSRSAPASTTL